MMWDETLTPYRLIVFAAKHENTKIGTCVPVPFPFCGYHDNSFSGFPHEL